MNFEGLEKKKISIVGAGNSIELTDFSLVDVEFCKSIVTLKADWFEASVLFEASSGRFIEFIGDIKDVLRSGAGSASFINEDGNFELDIKLTVLGRVDLWVVLCKDMIDDSHIKYSFPSDRTSLEFFLKNLELVFS